MGTKIYQYLYKWQVSVTQSWLKIKIKTYGFS